MLLKKIYIDDNMIVPGNSGGVYDECPWWLSSERGAVQHRDGIELDCGCDAVCVLSSTSSSTSFLTIIPSPASPARLSRLFCSSLRRGCARHNKARHLVTWPSGGEESAGYILILLYKNPVGTSLICDLIRNVQLPRPQSGNCKL